MKKKKLCAGLCAGLVTFSTVISSMPVLAKEDTEVQNKEWEYQTSWEEVSGLLDKHLGVYEEPSSFDPTTRHTPDGPLMGNGTVLGFLGGKSTGDKKNQTIYLSRLDNFEELNQNQRDVQYVGYGGLDIERTDSDASVSDFRMEQDMKQARAKGLSESGFQTETWISAKENIIVSEITNVTQEPMDLDIFVWTNVTNKVDQGISSVDAGIDEENQLIYTSRKTGSKIYNWSVNSTTAVKLLDKDAELKQVDNHTSKFSVNLAGAEKIYMVAAVEGGKESETYQTDAINKVVSYDSMEKIDAASKAHQAWWQEYWLKSYLSLDEKSDSIEKLYFGHMYQIGCALQAISENRAKGVTTGLFPWTGSSAPNWQGDYTLNSDAQRPISVAITANRLNHIDNYTEVMQDFWPTGVKNASNPQHLNWLIAGSARAKFTDKIRGSLYPTHIGPWGSRTEHFNAPNDYFCSPANGTMVLQPMIQYYKSTLDEAYLEDSLYPMVREQANFWVDYAEKDSVTGKYNIYGATYESSSAFKNATLDLASAEFMLKNAIAFSEHLGADENLRTQWNEVHDNLAEYPTKNGYYIEDERGKDPITFSCFNVYGFAFYDLVGPSASQEEKDKILLWLENKQEFGTSDKQTRAAMTSARVGFDPHIWLDKMKAGYIDRAPEDWMGIRSNNTVGDIGGSLFSGAIMESLMQSHEEFINFFPAWYDDQEASFKNLRAYGAFTVSGKQNAWGQVESAVIHSEKGTECSVLNPWQEENLEMKVYKDGEEVKTNVEKNNLGNVYTFKTEAGADYELVRSGELPEKIVIDKEKVTFQKGETVKLNASTNSGAKIKWTSDNESVATVAEDGTVTAVGMGKAKVRAEASEELFAVCDVSVLMTLEAELFTNASDVTIENGNTTVGYIDDGDWMEYKISIDKPGEYSAKYRVSVNSKMGEVEFVTNDQVLMSTELPTTGGWNNWVTVSDTLKFSAAGEYMIRLNVVKGGWNFDKLELQLEKEEHLEGDIAKIVTEIPKLQVVTGTAWESLLPLLPKRVEVELSNKAKTVLPVEWSSESYTGESSIVLGNLVCSDKITNPNKIQAKAEIVVEEINKEILEKFYNQYEALDQGMYTDESWNVLQDELKYTRSILDKEDASISEMLDAKIKLESAFASLKEIEGVEIRENEASIYLGIPQKLTVRNNTEKELTWGSSNDAVATVDKDGIITPLSKGTTTISVSADDTEYKDSCQITVLRNERNYNLENPIFTESGHHENFVPQNAADGKTGGTPSESSAYSWVSPNVPIIQPRWIAVSFPEPVTINKWRVAHIDKDKDGKSITRDFELQISDDGSTWTSVDTVADNTELVNDRTFADNSEITAKNFRLYITKADNYNGAWPNNMARIDEWELVYEYGNYTVEFQPGEGVGEAYRQELRYNETKMLDKNTFTKEGYTFDGWLDENGNQYTDGQEVLNLTDKKEATVILTAQWKQSELNSKKTLERYLLEAKEHVANGNTDGLIESIQKQFEEAISEGEAVMANNEATKEEVRNATVKLMYAIQSLDFRIGDKTDLGMALELTESIDLSKYVEAGKAEYETAKAEAERVMGSSDVLQEEVDAAWNALVDTVLNLRLKADKAVLEELIHQADSIDIKLYKEETVSTFTSVLEIAKVVMADDTLSVADQEKVDQASVQLDSAIKALQLKADGGNSGENNDSGNTGNSNTKNTSNNSNNNQKEVVKTGDMTSTLLPVLGIGDSFVLLVAAGGMLLRRKKR